MQIITNDKINIRFFKDPDVNMIMDCINEQRTYSPDLLTPTVIHKMNEQINQDRRLPLIKLLKNINFSNKPILQYIKIILTRPIPPKMQKLQLGIESFELMGETISSDKVFSLYWNQLPDDLLNYLLTGNENYVKYENYTTEKMKQIMIGPLKPSADLIITHQSLSICCSHQTCNKSSIGRKKFLLNNLIISCHVCSQHSISEIIMKSGSDKFVVGYGTK